jgi:hypothetical protein
MNGNGVLGAEAPMVFSLRRSSDLWSEFFTQNDSQSMDLHIGFLNLFSALFLQNWRYPE